MTPLLAALLALAAQAADGPVASPEPGWPQWRGPRRDAVSEEKGLLQAWPEGGPPRLWSVETLGKGWSSPIVTGGRVHVTGDSGDDCVLYAFDLDGKPVWKAVNGRSWKGPYPGARACPAAAGGRLFHMNAHGRVVCLEAATGRELWAVHVLERFEGKNITWATSECLLVDGPRVIVTPGGKKALMAALDAKTGETVWTSEPLEGDAANYTSPILVLRGGRRLLMNCSQKNAFGVDAETGKRLWTVPMKTPYDVTVSTPVYGAGMAHFAAPYIVGAGYRLSEDGARVEAAWPTPFDTCSGSFVLAGGVLYGGGYRKFRHWIAVDWETGETRGAMKELMTGSAVWADGRLHVLAEDGRAALVTPVAEGFRIAGEFRFTPRRVNDAWAHPVVLDGRLYLRHHDVLSCYDVRPQ
jgi:outer membrane protein assembly factor BamB